MKVIVSRSLEKKARLYILFVGGLASFDLIDIMSVCLPVCVDYSKQH